MLTAAHCLFEDTEEEELVDTKSLSVLLGLHKRERNRREPLRYKKNLFLSETRFEDYTLFMFYSHTFTPGKNFVQTKYLSMKTTVCMTAKQMTQHCCYQVSDESDNISTQSDICQMKGSISQLLPLCACLKGVWTWKELMVIYMVSEKYFFI